MNLKQMRKLHATAQLVTELKDKLYWIEYPGLVLIVSVRHLISFHAYDKWHLVTGHDTGSIKADHEHFLSKNLDNFKHFLSRKELTNELKLMMKKDKLCH